jgi:hypothetical protein
VKIYKAGPEEPKHSEPQFAPLPKYPGMGSVLKKLNFLAGKGKFK